MTAPAPSYDLKEERPKSDYELSRVALRRLMMDGRRAWLRLHDEPPDLSNVVWHLLGEAADTARAIQADRPAQFKSAWPDFCFDESDLRSYENQTLTEAREAARDEQILDPDLYAVGSKTLPRASAEALNRFIPSLSMLRWVRAKSLYQKKRRMKFIFALASGLSPTRAATIFPELGYRTKGAVLAARHRSLLAIVEKIELKCGKDILTEGVTLEFC